MNQSFFRDTEQKKLLEQIKQHLNDFNLAPNNLSKIKNQSSFLNHPNNPKMIKLILFIFKLQEKHQTDMQDTFCEILQAKDKDFTRLIFQAAKNLDFKEQLGLFEILEKDINSYVKNGIVPNFPIDVFFDYLYFNYVTFQNSEQSEQIQDYLKLIVSFFEKIALHFEKTQDDLINYFIYKEQNKNQIQPSPVKNNEKKEKIDIKIQRDFDWQCLNILSQILDNYNQNLFSSVGGQQQIIQNLRMKLQILVQKISPILFQNLNILLQKIQTFDLQKQHEIASFFPNLLQNYILLKESTSFTIEQKQTFKNFIEHNLQYIYLRYKVFQNNFYEAHILLNFSESFFKTLKTMSHNNLLQNYEQIKNSIYFFNFLIKNLIHLTDTQDFKSLLINFSIYIITLQNLDLIFIFDQLIVFCNKQYLRNIHDLQKDKWLEIVSICQLGILQHLFKSQEDQEKIEDILLQTFNLSDPQDEIQLDLFYSSITCFLVNLQQIQSNQSKKNDLMTKLLDLVREQVKKTRIILNLQIQQKLYMVLLLLLNQENNDIINIIITDINNKIFSQEIQIKLFSYLIKTKSGHQLNWNTFFNSQEEYFVAQNCKFLYLAIKNSMKKKQNAFIFRNLDQIFQMIIYMNNMLSLQQLQKEIILNFLSNLNNGLQDGNKSKIMNQDQQPTLVKKIQNNIETFLNQILDSQPILNYIQIFDQLQNKKEYTQFGQDLFYTYHIQQFLLQINQNENKYFTIQDKILHKFDNEKRQKYKEISGVNVNLQIKDFLQIQCSHYIDQRSKMLQLKVLIHNPYSFMMENLTISVMFSKNLLLLSKNDIGIEQLQSEQASKFQFDFRINHVNSVGFKIKVQQEDNQLVTENYTIQLNQFFFGCYNNNQLNQNLHEVLPFQRNFSYEKKKDIQQLLKFLTKKNFQIQKTTTDLYISGLTLDKVIFSMKLENIFQDKTNAGQNSLNLKCSDYEFMLNISQNIDNLFENDLDGILEIV